MALFDLILKQLKERRTIEDLTTEELKDLKVKIDTELKKRE